MSGYKNGGNNNMLWEQGVPGSNPGTPTQKTKELQKCDSFFCYPRISSIFTDFGRRTKNHFHLVVLSCDFCQCNALIHLVLSIYHKKHSEHCCHFPDFGKTLKKRRILFDNLHVIIHLHFCEYVCWYS